MEPLFDNTKTKAEVLNSFVPLLQNFLSSSEPLCLLASDEPLLKEFALQRLLQEAALNANPLVIQGHPEFSAEQLLIHLQSHWRLLIPVRESGFRVGLVDFLQACRRKMQNGLLIINHADQLPIATQAALIHLLHEQEKNTLVLKVALLADTKMASQLALFHPEGVSQMRLPAEDPLFTQWVVQRAVKEAYPAQEPVPSDIIDLAHSFSKGKPEDMRWIVDRWYAAADYAKRNGPVAAWSSLDDVKDNPVSSGRVRLGIWGHRRAVASGLFALALVVGMGSAHFQHRGVPFSLNTNDKSTYTLEALNTTDRIQALHWVTEHPDLKDTEVSSDKGEDGKQHYHVNFGRFATKEEASKELQKLPNTQIFHIHQVA
jgi:hypothetical protein